MANKSGGKTTTIINNPPSESGGGMGMLVGLIILLVLGYLLWIYGLPALRNMQVPTPTINVPSEIDVNINQSGN
ncbi:MAG: hypothetical protein UW68_C0032G0003 [Candidatus Collierbacteria bacterium GW2011_GWB1_44_6]|uniref:Uncharacterized protein n=2 Tax=Candidatus Collieribacteriota TaxID=1752725 RepID=A0A0G1JMH4_9BACT|nr:MAG: hypothetical protein UV68_C0018G0012 [Candidatus Collierbacteria bacterium GW2011_GWC2_43_12]KKT72580.1 MAG: hypothetical protein UW68_C0032G0003 [Candidatus Collierbacteria bacterium GW2011_GWB1_44_6]KKT83428.1 MAG: hypothetical protein UW80_C0014G0007 [Microgenomates group bacterium GW2011_GWC1_44_9]